MIIVLEKDKITHEIRNKLLKKGLSLGSQHVTLANKIIINIDRIKINWDTTDGVM